MRSEMKQTNGPFYPSFLPSMGPEPLSTSGPTTNDSGSASCRMMKPIFDNRIEASWTMILATWR